MVSYQIFTILDFQCWWVIIYNCCSIQHLQKHALTVVIAYTNAFYKRSNTYLDTWILGVVSEQLILLRGQVGDSTAVVDSLSPAMFMKY